MGTRRSAKDLAGLREEFVLKAGEAFDRMFGQDGQNGLVTFTEREDRACEAGDALTQWLVGKHVEMDPSGDPCIEVECPMCGTRVRYDSAEAARMEIRGLQTRRGRVEYRRAARRCPRCRTIFFPH